MAPRALLLVLAALGAAACGNDTRARPDAAPDAAFPCLTADDGLGAEGQDVGLTIGVLEDEQFRELADGDTLAATVGPQGLYMLVLEMRGTLPISFDDACLRSQSQVEFETLDDIDNAGRIDFRRVTGDLFSGQLLVLIGPVNAIPRDEVEGAVIDLSVSCADWGMSGAAALEQLSLFVFDPLAADAGPG